jgi:hypothetical protein
MDSVFKIGVAFLNGLISLINVITNGTSVICKLKCIIVRLKHSGHELESRSELNRVSTFDCTVVRDVLRNENNLQTTDMSIEVYL